MSNTTRILWMGTITLVGFPLIAWLIETGINDWNPLIFFEVFISKSNLLFELVLGVAVGTIMGFVAWQFIVSKVLLPILKKYGGMVKSMNLNLSMILFVSTCAGVGEEVFFRGVVQTYLGVVITSVLFVAIHGYLHPKDWRITLYGAFMVLMISLIGIMHEQFGLTSAMMAHTMIDVVLFYKLTNYTLKDLK